MIFLGGFVLFGCLFSVWFSSFLKHVVSYEVMHPLVKNPAAAGRRFSPFAEGSFVRFADPVQ
jgi:hypothetical protein